MPYKYGAPALQPRYSKVSVWASPVSLAATKGIARVVFHLHKHNAQTENNSLLFSIPPGTEMFHFPGFALCLRKVTTYVAGFPHSDTSGSKVKNHLPEAFRWLIASFIAVTCLGIHRAPFNVSCTET